MMCLPLSLPHSFSLLSLPPLTELKMNDDLRLLNQKIAQEERNLESMSKSTIAESNAYMHVVKAISNDIDKEQAIVTGVHRQLDDINKKRVKDCSALIRKCKAESNKHAKDLESKVNERRHRKKGSSNDFLGTISSMFQNHF